MKSKKRLVIAIIIILILVLAIAGAVFAYVYIKTDTFKTDKELFAKYISQNAETLQKFSDSQILKKQEELKNEEQFETDIKVKTTYSEGGEVSSNINNLAGTINIQKNAADNYFYMDGQLLLGEQKYLESEIIKDQEAYGIRFTDVAKQFITITENQDLVNVASDIGIDSATLENIMNAIDGTGKISEVVVSDEDTQNLKEKYSKIITDTISAGKFSSNKKAMITYNNNTINTKAYTVTITSEQIENLLLQILNNLKDEEVIVNNANISKEKYIEEIDKEISNITEEKEIPEVKLTVYEQNGNTIRTVAEIGTNKIIIENTQTSEGLKTKIQVNIINYDKIDEYAVEIIKSNKDGEENINFNATVNKDDEQYTLSFLNDMKYSDSNLQLKSSINYKKDILTVAVDLENNTAIGKDFDKKQELNNNSFMLNNTDETVRKSIIEQLKQRVPEKAKSRIELLKETLGFSDDTTEETTIPEAQMTQVDINKFNAKFEFYTGDEISAENIKTLLGIVKSNCNSSETTTIDDENTTNSTNPNKIKYKFRLGIERNKTDEEENINQILEKISDKKKYKVEIFYKEQNKLIDYITIEDVTK